MHHDAQYTLVVMVLKDTSLMQLGGSQSSGGAQCRSNADRWTDTHMGPGTNPSTTNAGGNQIIILSIKPV